MITKQPYHTADKQDQLGAGSRASRIASYLISLFSILTFRLSDLPIFRLSDLPIFRLSDLPTFRLFLILSPLFLNTACEEVMLKSDPADKPSVIFEHLWSDINDRYAYFELKEIDWNAVGNEYRSQISDNMDEFELFNVLADMLYQLRDGHVNLTSSFDRSRNWQWFQDFLENYNQHVIDRYYLKKDFLITGPLHNQVIDSVLYVNYRSFADQITHSHLDQLMERARPLKGVIIDVRHNGGGSLQNGAMLASCFVEEPMVYARQRFKNGSGKDDFTSWEDMTIRPRNGQRFSGPVVLLTNRRSYSASNFFAQMMKVIPHAIVMGDNTGGGGGIPVFGELPNGWTYRFSASQAITPDGEHLEITVPVDVRLDMHFTDDRRGTDTIIETALEYIKSQ